eukprot:7248907-Pyramimonas_sp.AAC.1
MAPASLDAASAGARRAESPQRQPQWGQEAPKVTAVELLLCLGFRASNAAHVPSKIAQQKTREAP